MVTLLRKIERKTWYKQVKNSEVSYAHIWMCVCVCVCVYTYIYVYICTHYIHIIVWLVYRWCQYYYGKIQSSNHIQLIPIMKKVYTDWCYFILGGSKITADGDYSHEIKRSLLPGGEVMTNLDSILKSSNITYNGGVEGHVLSFSCKNSKITTRCWTTVERRKLYPTKYKIPDIQGKRRCPSKKVRGVKWHLEWNPIPSRDARRAQIIHVPTRTQRPQRHWARTVFESPVGVPVSSGLLQGQGLLVQQTWVWHQPSWRRAALTPP